MLIPSGISAASAASALCNNSSTSPLSCCSNLQACSQLKQDIRAAFDALPGYKLVAFPWPSQTEPVVLTHWGRILRLRTFSARVLRSFADSNRGRAPEPNAP